MRRASINVHIGIALLLAMIGIFVSLVLLGANENRVADLFVAQNGGVQRARALCRYEHLANALANALQPGVATRDTPRGLLFADTLRDLHLSAAELQDLFRNSSGPQQRLADIHRQVAHWIDEVVSALAKADRSTSDQQSLGRYDALRTTMATLDQSFRQIEQQIASAHTESLWDAIAGMRQTASGVAAIVIMGVLVLWWWSIGAIRRGLRTMENALADVARGKTSAAIDPGRLPQEFGNVVRAYHDVCEHLVDRSSVHARDLEKLNEQLLKGLITICSSCKRIRTEHGQWVPIEAYVRSRTTADFTHALCQECLNKTLDNL